MDDCFMIYPVYLDLNRRKSQGRKFRKELCVESPHIKEIKSVLDNLELEYRLEENKKHPRSPFHLGRVRVPKMYGKMNVVQSIAAGIRELRQKNEEMRAASMKDAECSSTDKKDAQAIRENLNSNENKTPAVKKLVSRKKSNKKKNKNL